jgi:hypothetical protein
MFTDEYIFSKNTWDLGARGIRARGLSHCDEKQLKRLKCRKETFKTGFSWKKKTLVSATDSGGICCSDIYLFSLACIYYYIFHLSALSCLLGLSCA